jgi:uncharacterized Zn finger protein
MATRFGLTWWGRRWIGSLEALGSVYANRLPRGRTYARRGAVRRLEIGPGHVTARVDGSRAVPYRVTLRLPAFTDEQWDAIFAALSGQLRHAAALLDGRMPDDVDDTLAACGLSLFPHAGDLTTSCSCPDHANPCKHVAAVHYVLAQTFDDDPFLLPALRGRDRTALLAALRAARTGGVPPPDDDGPAADAGIALADLHAARLYDARGDLALIAVHPTPPTDSGAPLRRLGPPPLGDETTSAALIAAVERAAERAWQLAAGDDGEGAGDGGAGPNDDPVLGELRRRGSATSRDLADALGRPPDQVRARLRSLVAEGAVDRTGHARSTRYHAW